MGKVIVKASPDLKAAAQRKREPIKIVREDIEIPGTLREQAAGKKYFIRTYGCQANVLDSQTMEGILQDVGYAPCDDPFNADVVILNTCAIRENAEDKVFGEIGALKALKNKNPDALIGVCGCMVQEPHVVDSLKSTYRQVDLIFGTHNIHHLPKLMNEALMNKKRIIEVYSKEGEVIENMPIYRSDKAKAFVNIMYGCDKFCTYCIVPYTRGKQRSRLKEDIMKECEELVKEGYVEITLIGQNVNAYGKDLNNGSTFADLLDSVAKLGIPRLRFTTSHPWDFTDEMFEAIANNKNIMPAIHLPLQSGSSKVLKMMGRRYSAEDYIALVDRIKAIVPNVAITTDIIVGFPTETEEDFQKTLEVCKYVSYDFAFTFLYSPRVGTPAARMKDDTPDEVKHERFNRLLAVLNEDFKKHADAYLGKTVEVLVDGYSKTNGDMLTGYTDTNKLVNFVGKEDSIGKIVKVKVSEATTFYLKGEQVSE